MKVKTQSAFTQYEYPVPIPFPFNSAIQSKRHSDGFEVGMPWMKPSVPFGEQRWCLYTKLNQ